MARDTFEVSICSVCAAAVSVPERAKATKYRQAERSSILDMMAAKKCSERALSPSSYPQISIGEILHLPMI